MSDSSIYLFPEVRSYTAMSTSIDDSATPLYPEIRNSMDDSAILVPERRRYIGMDSRLYMATQEGDVNALNKLIQEIIIFQQFTGLGNSVLHIALSCGKLQFAEILIEEVKNNSVAGREFIRAKNSDGDTALHLAAFYNHYRLVKKLVSVMKGDVEDGNGALHLADFLRSQNREGNTVLHEATKAKYYWMGKYIKIVKLLLKHNRDLINMQNNEGESALFVASQNGNTRIVEELLYILRTSNSNMKRKDGRTPLHSAVLNGHTDVVHKLLHHCPELAEETDNCGRTAMHMLALSVSRTGFLGLFDYRRLNTAKIVGHLLAKDNSLCYKEDNNKQSPIQLALEWERYDLVKILLLCGRDCIEAVDKDGRKPLHLAVRNTTRLTSRIFKLYQFKVMLLSLISKESVNHRDNTGRTPLQLAQENWGKDPSLYNGIIKVLENHGALKIPDNQEPARAWLKGENVSINAVLIATVSFAAAFTLPGGFDSHEQKAVLLKTFLFKLFVICDTLSFCASIASAIIIQFADKRDQQDHRQIVWAIHILWLALASLLVAFGAAIHIVITPSPLLAATVWTMISFVPLYILFCFLQTMVFLEMSTIWVPSAFTLALISLGFTLVFPWVPVICLLLAILMFGTLIFAYLSRRRASQVRLLKRQIHDGR